MASSEEESDLEESDSEEEEEEEEEEALQQETSVPSLSAAVSKGARHISSTGDKLALRFAHYDASRVLKARGEEVRRRKDEEQRAANEKSANEEAKVRKKADEVKLRTKLQKTLQAEWEKVLNIRLSEFREEVLAEVNAQLEAKFKRLQESAASVAMSALPAASQPAVDTSPSETMLAKVREEVNAAVVAAEKEANEERIKAAARVAGLEVKLGDTVANLLESDSKLLASNERVKILEASLEKLQRDVGEVRARVNHVQSLVDDIDGDSVELGIDRYNEDERTIPLDAFGNRWANQANDEAARMITEKVKQLEQKQRSGAPATATRDNVELKKPF